MRLLVSVRNAIEAAAALAGGADVIDAKNPLAGALGAVSLETLGDIRLTVASRRPLTAALGDANDEATIERTAHMFALAGARFVKIGFAGVESDARVAGLLMAAIHGAKAASYECGVVPVAYTDTDRVASPRVASLIEVAWRTGADGLLFDTADKSGPGLRELIAPGILARWIADAHSADLFVALAGKLTADDLMFAQDAGADIAGVRGAACDGGRNGCVAVDKVRRLRALCGPSTAPDA
jgi:(5-formylfuran-3-yl)methyl phosphate synthase